MRSFSLLNFRAFLLLIASSMLLVSVQPANAQPRTKVDPSNVRSRMAIITVKNRAALHMDLQLARVHFSAERLRAADPSTSKTDLSPYVRSVQVWTEEAYASQGRKKSARERLSSHSTVRGDAAQQYEMRVNDPLLRRAFFRHLPKRIVRAFNPPYDTLLVQESSRVDKLRDLSLHYNLIFPDSTHRNAFLDEVKELSSIVEARKPLPPGSFELDIGGIPPNEMR